ncbi:hypothetical protein HYW17_02670 [Candidatus Uhrbacteria bacterium]|nr:hypothetical protein [Candidatus Uhrbacteria bacterium]
MRRDLPVKKTPEEVLKAVARGQVHHFHRYVHKMRDDLVEALQAFQMFRELLPAGYAVEGMYRADEKRPDPLGRQIVRADGVYLTVEVCADSSSPSASIALQDEGGIYGGVTYDASTHRWSCWIDGEGIRYRQVYRELSRSSVVFPRKTRKGPRGVNVGKQTALYFVQYMVAVFLDH